MSKNWNTTINVVATPQPHGWTNQRMVEYSASATNVNLYIDQNGNLYMRWGDDNAFDTANVGTQLTGAAPAILVHNPGVITNASMSIDQNNDHVHIVYTDGTDVWHAECITPNNPNLAGSWTNLTLGKFQLVTTNGNTVGSCDVFVDSALGNGNNEPCVVWDESNAGVWEVWFNRPVGGGPHIFNGAGAAAIALAATAQHAQYPTVTVNWEDGRTIYAFYVQVVAAVNDDIECTRCLNAANPLVAANWGGPLAGAGAGADAILTATGAGTWPTGPSCTWHSDANPNLEHVGVVAVDVAGVVQSEKWFQGAGPAAWMGPWTIAGYNGTAQFATLQHVVGIDFRVLVQNTSGRIDHCRKVTNPSMGGGDSWYQLATSLSVATDPHSSEWRCIEHADGALAWRRSHCVFNQAAPALFFSQCRENTNTAPTLVAPASSGYYDELTAIEFDWTFADTEQDLQREYYCEIDDDSGFGSVVADPGAPAGDLVLNAWTTSPISTWDLEAATLSAGATYYWRVKTRDSEYGTEYDPNSESGWPGGTGYETFLTTPDFTLDVTGTSQKADGGCEVQFTITFPAGVNYDNDIELYHATGTLTGGEYYDSAWNEMTANASWHSGGAPDGIVATGGDTVCTYGWDAIGDLAADWDGNVSVKLSGRFLNNYRFLGTNPTDTLAAQYLDFADPASVALGTPVGATTTQRRPTISFSATDTTGWEGKIEVHRNAGYTDLLVESLYLGSGVTSWKLTVDLEYAGDWYVRLLTRDTTVTQNENSAWTTGDFEYIPPPDPTECFFGDWSIEVDPTRRWTGSEFDVVDDVIGRVTYAQRTNAPHTLSFSLQNISGKFVMGASDFKIKMGDEVKMTRENANFYGVIRSIRRSTQKSRIIEVYCESFAGEADSFPIQIRVIPTARSGLYWEDYINLALANAGTKPKWFQLVDLGGNPYYMENTTLTPVLGEIDLIYDKVSHVEFLNDIVSRTGKIWYEGTSIPGGRKAYIYFGDAGDPSTGTTAATFYLESDVLAESLTEDRESLINRVIFSDADVMEQDMDSIRTYGVHTKLMSSSSIADTTRLAEIAQYIIEERKSPRASGSVPVFGEPDITVNELVRIYEEDADDLASGFSGNYLVVSVIRILGKASNISLELTSRWENPIIKQIQEIMTSKGESGGNDELIVLRGETAEARLECPTDGVSNATLANDIGRIGMDRVSDTDTDANYYTVYGGPY